MTEDKENTQITEANLSFIEKELSKSNKPFSLEKITRKLAYKKTSSQLEQEVKKYDSYCKYEVGDFIYKEYDEPLMVSSKGMEPFKGAVVLEVMGKSDYKDFNCEMLEVDYSGGGIFRKYIDYMKKTKTQVLLPSNCEGKAKDPEIIEKKEDPRLSALPMTDRDLKKLEKNLSSALNKSSKFFNWNDHWQLTEKQIEIKKDKIEKIKDFIQKTNISAATTELVDKFFDIKSTDDLFELYCMSLTFTLDKKHKKDFIQVSPLEWGKWHLKKALQSTPQDLPLSAPKAKVPAYTEEQVREGISAQESPLKVYLGWREILSGGIKVPKSMSKEFSSAREYIFTDTEGEKDYIVYYYPSSGFLLGLEALYEANNIPQGASLTLERKGLNQFNFWLKTSKKKISVLKVSYDPKKDVFDQSGEEVFTFSTPNKIIHLETETLKRLFSLFDQRRKLDLAELLVLVFKNFGMVGKKCSLHYLRAYHLVDVLKRTTPEDVEKTLNAIPEFSRSEKNKAVFIYKEKVEIEAEEEIPEEEVEIPAEIPAEEEMVEEGPPAAPAFEAPVEKIPSMPERERKERARFEAPAEQPRTEAEPEEEAEKPYPPKKEKVSKKKRMRMEAERLPRGQKGVRKIIEEKIEAEEGEQEAFAAIKERVVEEAAREKEKVSAQKEEEKPRPAASGEPTFGLFAEKLKTALDKKDQKKKQKK